MSAALALLSSPPSSSSSSSSSSPAPIKVNLGDASAIKHVLDEQAALAVCAAGYEEDVTLSNLKLLLGALAVCIAAACNLLPAPFPSSLRLIQWSVALYLLCHLLLQALHLTLPRHCILITRQRRQLAAAAAAAASSASLDPVRRRALLRSARPSPLLSTTPPLLLRSQLARYDTRYCLTLEERRAGGSRAERQLDITHCFDSGGLLLRDEYEQEVRRLLQQLEASMSKRQ